MCILFKEYFPPAVQCLVIRFAAATSLIVLRVKESRMHPMCVPKGTSDLVYYYHFKDEETEAHRGLGHGLGQITALSLISLIAKWGQHHGPYTIVMSWHRADPSP